LDKELCGCGEMRTAIGEAIIDITNTYNGIAVFARLLPPGYS